MCLNKDMARDDRYGRTFWWEGPFSVSERDTEESVAGKIKLSWSRNHPLQSDMPKIGISTDLTACRLWKLTQQSTSIQIPLPLCLNQSYIILPGGVLPAASLFNSFL